MGGLIPMKGSEADRARGIAYSLFSMHLLVPHSLWLRMLLRVAFVVGFVSISSYAAAQTVIESGREDEVLQLFEPHVLSGEVVPGWQLRHVSIQERSVDCQLRGPEETTAVLRLSPLERAPEGAERSGSFWFERVDSSGAGAEALTALVKAVQGNDDGRFWQLVAAPPVATHRIRMGGEWGHWEDLLGELSRDGIAWFLAVILFLGILLRRVLRGTGLRVMWTLLAIFGLGLLVRLTLSPHSPLGAWIFSRDMYLTHHVWRGPLLLALSTSLETQFGKFDVMSSLNFACAVLTPLVVFLHGRLLLGSLRLGLLAAGMVAILPMHVRFSASEVSFIPSILFSSLLFVGVHSALRESVRTWRWVLLASLVPIAWGVLQVRPLNYGFIPLLLFIVWFLVPRDVPRNRRILVSGLLLAISGFLFVTEFLGQYGRNVEEGLDPFVLVRGIAALFTPRHNALLHPWVTPPAFLLLVMGGGVLGWRAGRKRLVGFLGAWLLGFFFTHAYVLPGNVAMQARYHLHLVVPAVFLAALGLEALWELRPRLAWGAGLLLLASPWIHSDFIEDLAFNELREHAFVMEQAAAIPDGCTIYEYVGGLGEQESRFRRAGLVLSREGRAQRFDLRPIADSPDSPEPLSRSVWEELRNPPECAYLYEGLPCFGEKEREESISPVCRALRDAAPNEKVAEIRFTSRLYDPTLGRGFRGSSPELQFSLHRILSPAR